MARYLLSIVPIFIERADSKLKIHPQVKRKLSLKTYQFEQTKKSKSIWKWICEDGSPFTFLNHVVSDPKIGNKQRISQGCIRIDVNFEKNNFIYYLMKMIFTLKFCSL